MGLITYSHLYFNQFFIHTVGMYNMLERISVALQKLMGLLLNKQHVEAVFWDTTTLDLKQTSEIPSSAGSQPLLNRFLLTYSACLYFQGLK